MGSKLSNYLAAIIMGISQGYPKIQNPSEGPSMYRGLNKKKAPGGKRKRLSNHKTFGRNK